MADYFIDASAGVGGNGLSPGSAFISMQSIPWTSGDIAWLRRTHIESVANNTIIVRTLSGAGQQQLHAIVGWPDTNYPMYAQRPISAVSAGWDSDLPATAVYSVFGLKFPTISSSATNVSSASRWGQGYRVYNICIDQAGSSAIAPFNFLTSRNELWDNVIFTRSHNVLGGNMTPSHGWPIRNLGKFFMAGSAGPSADMFGGAVSITARHIVITSLCVSGSGGILPSNADEYTRIDIIENLSNSLTAVFGRDNQLVEGVLAIQVIGRMIGVEPVCLVNSAPSTSILRFNISVEDYFGKGPLVSGARGLNHVSPVTSLEALYTGTGRGVIVNVESVIGTSQYYISYNQNLRALTKYIDVISGQAITMQLPVYVGSSAVYSLSGLGGLQMVVNAKGCPRIAPSTLQAGSLGAWAGSLVAGGSAWYANYQWTPTETGRVSCDVYIPQPVNATSGAPANGYILLTEPYSV